MDVKVYNQEGAEVGSVPLNESLFGVEPNPALVHQYVVNYLANQRQGTAASKGRSEVSGGGTKPWRQKGTGRARAGSIRSPLWRGGGIIFGPQPRNYTRNLPRRMKRGALISAFSDKALHDNIRVIENLELGAVKTKNMATIIDKLGLQTKKCLILDEGENRNLILSVRNLQKVTYLRAPLANAFEVVHADIVLFTKAGLKKVEEVFTS